ncbi:MAG: hypothetical protein K2N48_08915 [Muribaculaceae bacterium]|nr:hypothetical protein [Muribaculaceae bacterium]
MLNKIIIPSRDFEEDDWEDPSVSGWLALYCVWMIIEIIIGTWDIYQLPFVPGWSKGLGYISFLLPLYSLISVLMRFRNAVAVSLLCLMIFVLNSIVNFIVFLACNEFISAISVVVLGIGLNVCWIFYFFKSHLVAVRFPKYQRHIFAFDWLLFIFFVGLTLLTTLSSLVNLGNYSRNSSEEYKETMELAKKMNGLSDHGVYFVDCKIDANFCVVYFAPIEGNMSKSDFDAIVNQPYFADMLLYKIDKVAPEFIKSAIGDGLILVFNVFQRNIGDGRIFKIYSEQIRNLKGPDPLSDLTTQEMEEIREEIERILPSCNIKNVSMKSSGWVNEVVLNIDFEVDEDKTKYMNVYDDFKVYADEMKQMLMKNRGKNASLDALWRRGMTIIFVLKGSKTGYSQEITVF